MYAIYQSCSKLINLTNQKQDDFIFFRLIFLFIVLVHRTFVMNSNNSLRIVY
jgi:hypothetical protein